MNEKIDVVLCNECNTENYTTEDEDYICADCTNNLNMIEDNELLYYR